MILIGMSFRLGITLALYGMNVDNYALFRALCPCKHCDELVEIMSVYRTEVGYTVLAERLANTVQISEILRYTAHIDGYRHIVVIDYGNKFLMQSGRVVKRFVDKSARHSSVADQRNYLFLVADIGAQ